MADRARLANIPMPEAALKCPRCESTNTKFCYFNNYSLTQPRHFCKTCRRYWTRGGALRNVPVGGGYRRNKRSKGSSSKSSASGDRQTASGSSSTISSNSTGNTDILGLGHQVRPQRFMTPLHHLTEFGGSDHIGLNYGTMSAPLGGMNDLSFQMGSALASGSGGATPGASLLTMAGGGIEASGYGGEAGHHQVRPKISSSIATQMASVKMEDNSNNNSNQQELMNLSRQFLGLQGYDHYWGGTA
ncbi:hypothetical protein Goklo_018448 [Gossypium klotzschianum]|uniref:Dof zinc finger protein n=1 Tax=Gossypium klotzschianum TaxID=34286 RepID=A0A7J8UL35_9ROSI|nr:hypothetical protein [Gossypium klotzschianum]